eukprot:1548822-Pyramimonas_sp.AAC.1
MAAPTTATTTTSTTATSHTARTTTTTGMQAFLVEAVPDFVRSLQTAVRVRAAADPCPACICKPTLNCPPLACSCPAGEGLLTAAPVSSASSWCWGLGF